MKEATWLAVVSLGLSLVLTPLFRELFRFCGFVDHPDLHRKNHPSPIPRAGGVAIAFSYVATLFLVQALFPQAEAQLALVWKILPAASVIFAVGIVDDLLNLRPWQKLLGQLVAIGLACTSNIVVSGVAGFPFPLWLGIPVTAVWLLACTNAFNLVDGMDGLAAGVGLLATGTVFVAALVQHNNALVAATLPLIGCLLGFLRYNFNPASVFLGDSGSLTIGFLLGCYGIIWSQKSATLLGMTAPLMAVSIPLLDVMLSIARRALRRQPIFGADRGHIHHRLLDRGLTHRQTALLVYAVCAVVALLSLLESIVVDNRVSALIVLLFGGLLWFSIQRLGYTEFAAVAKLLLGGDLQRSVGARMDLDVFEKQLVNSLHTASCVELVCNTATKFGFDVTGMKLEGEFFIEPVRLPDALWEVRISLPDSDFVTLARNSEECVRSNAEAYFLESLRSSLWTRFPATIAEPAIRVMSASGL